MELLLALYMDMSIDPNFSSPLLSFSDCFGLEVEVTIELSFLNNVFASAAVGELRKELVAPLMRGGGDAGVSEMNLSGVAQGVHRRVFEGSATVS